MRYFDEEAKGKTPKETLVIMENEEAKIIQEALTEFCKNNPKKKKAKALLSDMEKWWSCFG